MANYEVPPALLQPYVPPGTELDFYEGKTYASIVGFRFLNTRLLGIPIPLHQNFTEVNLRFYVRYATPDGERRGTVFISEIVPKPAIVAVANTVYGEHYTYAPTRYSIQHDDQHLQVVYRWKRRRWNTIRAFAGRNRQPMAEGSIEEFIAEHYWGYTAINERTTGEYGVEHPPWEFYPVTSFDADVDVARWYGVAFVPYLTVPPASVFVAHGSEVVVRKGRRFTALVSA
jgi:uncharacterized protein YqjF (DUF2071 family)